MSTKQTARRRWTFLLGFVAIVLAVGFFSFHHNGRVQEAISPQPKATEVYRLRLGLNLGADSALHAAAVKFAERIKEKSQGRIQVTVFPDQQLGSDEQMLEMARAGSLDLLLTPTAKLSSDVPAMQYADLPFYFSDRTELYAMLDGEPGQLLLAKLKDVGLVGVTFWENGFKQFTANRPILSPKDFAGLRIRTMKSRLIMDQFSAMGAEPVVIDFANIRQALADHVVAGQENPLVAIAGRRIYEVQKHLTLSNHAWLGYVFSISRKVFESLPQDVRTQIIDTARELSSWERAETARREAGFLATIRAAGVEVHELNEAQRLRFAAALAPVVRRYGFEIGYDLLAKTEELRLNARLAKLQPTKKAPLLIGLDADLSGDGKVAGGAILRGMEMAVADVNAHGGVLGRPLLIMARDQMHNPERGKANLEIFAKLPGLLAVMGGKDGGVIDAELDSIHNFHLPYLIPWADVSELVENKQRPNFCFRLSLNHDWTAPFLLRHALARGKRIAVLLERSAMGRANEAALQASLKALPPGKVHIEWFNQGDNNFLGRLTDLQAHGVDGLIMVANPYEASAVVKAMAQLDSPIPILANWGLGCPSFWC
jgi:C4-dicarboxylate-binding protein DctP